jgi:hypothetical protein
MAKVYSVPIRLSETPDKNISGRHNEPEVGRRWLLVWNLEITPPSTAGRQEIAHR